MVPEAVDLLQPRFYPRKLLLSLRRIEPPSRQALNDKQLPCERHFTAHDITSIERR
jgi:hypothetical protein